MAVIVGKKQNKRKEIKKKNCFVASYEAIDQVKPLYPLLPLGAVRDSAAPEQTLKAQPIAQISFYQYTKYL